MGAPKRKNDPSGSKLAKSKQGPKPAIKLHQPLEGDSAPALPKDGSDGNTVPLDQYDGRKYFQSEKVPLRELRPSNPHFCPDRRWQIARHFVESGGKIPPHMLNQTVKQAVCFQQNLRQCRKAEHLEAI